MRAKVIKQRLLSFIYIQIKYLSEFTDYSMAFYIASGFLFATCVLVLFLEIKVPKTGEKPFKSLKKIINPSSLLLFFFGFLFGYTWGIHDTFLFIYLQEDLGASSQLISNALCIA